MTFPMSLTDIVIYKVLKQNDCADSDAGCLTDIVIYKVLKRIDLLSPELMSLTDIVIYKVLKHRHQASKGLNA